MMNEIIRVKNVSYAHYEELLLRRDSVKKEAFKWYNEYMREFGDEILKNFEIKIACIRKKKTIAFCQMAVNRGQAIDQNSLQSYLQKEMADYQAELEDMIAANNTFKDMQEISELDVLQIRKIYRRLAKQLHPDINPLTAKKEVLMDLWQRIVVAYKCNHLKELQELEILATKALSELGSGVIEVEIPDIDEKIAELELEIKHIMETDPYMYSFLLADEQALVQKHEALAEEYESYKQYEMQLDEVLNGLMTNGVTFTWRMN